ncbi:hypothetical protein D3C80_1820830 [compost metagenome]
MIELVGTVVLPSDHCLDIAGARVNGDEGGLQLTGRVHPFVHGFFSCLLHIRVKRGIHIQPAQLQLVIADPQRVGDQPAYIITEVRGKHDGILLALRLKAENGPGGLLGLFFRNISYLSHRV